MQKVTPFLWFDTDAEAAAQLYTSVIPNSRIVGVTRYGAGGPGAEGSVMTVQFELDGRTFVALNGGPAHAFTDAISFQVSCESQEEVDAYWDALTADGEEGRCGWLKDPFGVSWQIVPTVLPALLGDPDPERAQRAMAAMLGMSKLQIDVLEQAAAGAATAV